MSKVSLNRAFKIKYTNIKDKQIWSTQQVSLVQILLLMLRDLLLFEILKNHRSDKKYMPLSKKTK